MKSRFLSILVVAGLAACLGLAACGSSGGSASGSAPAGSASASASASAEASAAAALSDDDILFAVEEASPVDLSEMQNIRMSAERDGKRIVEFSTQDGDFSYTVDAYTGEILEKVEPEISATPAAATSSDPVEAAINACFDSLEGYNGGAENITVKIFTEDGDQKAQVTFDWDGETHDMVYNMVTGEIEE